MDTTYAYVYALHCLIICILAISLMFTTADMLGLEFVISPS